MSQNTGETPAHNRPAHNQDKLRFRSLGFTGIFGSALSGDLAAAIAGIAIPLLIIGPLGASDGVIGIAVAADDIGWLIAGPIAGVIIDRFGFTRPLIGSELVRFLAFALITVLALTGVLHPAVLIAFLVIKSVASVFFLIGSPSLLAQGVVEADLTKANSALTFSQSMSFILGPPLAGGIAALVSPEFALIVTTGCYFLSYLMLRLVLRSPRWVRTTPSTPRTNSTLLADYLVGWHYLVSRRDVVRMVASGAQFNFALSMQQAVLIVYLLTLPGFEASTVGLALGAAGIGGICAAMFADVIARKWGDSTTVFWTMIAGTGLGLLIPLTNSLATLPLLVLGYFGISIATVVFSAITGAYRQRTIPVEVLGRVTAASRFISWGIAPIGALLGGAIAVLSSPWTGLVASAILFFASAFWLLGVKWHSENNSAYS